MRRLGAQRISAELARGAGCGSPANSLTPVAACRRRPERKQSSQWQAPDPASVKAPPAAGMKRHE